MPSVVRPGLLGMATLLVIVILGHMFREPTLHVQTTEASSKASRIRLEDGRYLAYEINGAANGSHTLFWCHGLLSSRLEVLALDAQAAGHQEGTNLSSGLLQQLSIRLIGVDRPGYGQSDPHPARTLQSFAADLAQLADHLGANTFFVAGMSGGGPYAWSTAAYLPHRVKGVLILGAPASVANLTPKEARQYKQQVNPFMRMFLAAVALESPTARAFRAASQHPVAAHALHHVVLRPLMQWATHGMAAVDRKCLAEHHPVYRQRIVPEALLQKSAAAALEDLRIFHNAWAFNISHIHPQLAANTHIYYGAGDRQVPEVFARAAKRQVPAAQLTIVEGGGHIHYWFCDTDLQRTAFQRLIDGAPHAVP